MVNELRGLIDLMCEHPWASLLAFVGMLWPLEYFKDVAVSIVRAARKGE